MNTAAVSQQMHAQIARNFNNNNNNNPICKAPECQKTSVALLHSAIALYGTVGSTFYSKRQYATKQYKLLTCAHLQWCMYRSYTGICGHRR